VEHFCSTVTETLRARRPIYPKSWKSSTAPELLSRPPMKRTSILSLAFLIALVSLGAGGCVVHTHKNRGSYASKSHGCHPSQYWDGHQCRHKGKGHGARKHDGR
jgi:hypothetical protein